MAKASLVGIADDPSVDSVLHTHAQDIAATVDDGDDAVVAGRRGRSALAATCSLRWQARRRHLTPLYGSAGECSGDASMTATTCRYGGAWVSAARKHSAIGSAGRAGTFRYRSFIAVRRPSECCRSKRKSADATCRQPTSHRNRYARLDPPTGGARTWKRAVR